MLRGGFQIGVIFLVLLHHRADHEHLPPLAGQLFDKAVETGAVAAVDGEGVYLFPPRRQLVDDGNVQFAVDHQRQRAWDGRGRHDQHMGIAAGFGAERAALLYAEAVLLVGDDEGEVGKLHVLGQ